MTMTEEEAKKKWCPQMAAAGMLCDETERYGSHNGVVAARCIASECMAWRFKPQEWKHAAAYGGEWIDTQEVDGWGQKGEKLPTLGYCGLAGHP